MGSHQRGAETLPGAGMGCPRAGPPSSGKESGDAGKGGGGCARLEGAGWCASTPPPPVFCRLWGTLSDAPLSLCQPALRATQKTPESGISAGFTGD